MTVPSDLILNYIPGQYSGGGSGQPGNTPVGYSTGGGSSLGTSGGGSSGGSNVAWYSQPWFQNLLQAAGTYLAGKYLGGDTNAQRNLQNYSVAGFGSKGIQAFLPLALQAPFTEPYLASGIAGIGNLIMNPGQLAPGVSQAVNQRLASESQDIAQNYRGIQSNQAGALARGNAPVSIKAALESALNTQEERAMRQSRQAALAESDILRRQDLEQTYKILDALLQFTSSGKGQAIQGLGAAAGTAQQNQASIMALVGNLLQNLGRPQTAGAGA